MARLLTVILNSASSRPATGGTAQWVNIEAIQILTHHTSAVVASVILFWFVGWLVKRMLHDSIMKRAVLLLDELVLLCIFAYFAYGLVFVLYLRTPGLWTRLIAS
jgi:hypothetical protein